MSDSNPIPPKEQLTYELPDQERPASSAPTEAQLEQESPTGREKHDPYAAFRSPSYLRFALAGLVSNIGAQMTIAALGWQIAKLSQTSTVAASRVMWFAGFQLVPVFVLMIPAGALADWAPRKMVLTITSVLTGACSLLMSLLPYDESSFPALFALVCASSTFQTLGRPSRAALLPTIVPKHLFSNAVTWNSSVWQLASVVGPCLGGFLIVVVSTRLIYFIDCLCCFTYAIAIFTLKPMKLPPANGTVLPRDVDKSWFDRLTAGFVFVWRAKIIMATLLLDLLAVLFGGAVYLIPIFATDILHVGAFKFGCLRAADAIGALSMALLQAHLPPMKRAGRMMLIAVAGFGLATIVFGLSRWFWLSFIAIFFVGAFDNISVVVRHTLVQVLTPDSMRGRVSAVNQLFIGASNELGGVESGFTAWLFGPVISVVAGGLGTIVVVILIAIYRREVLAFGSMHDAKVIDEDENKRGFDVIADSQKPVT